MRWPWDRGERSFSEELEPVLRGEVVFDGPRGLDYYDLPTMAVTDDPGSQARYGADDVSWYGDLITGGQDPNPLLQGRERYEIFNEMRVSDPTVRSVLWMFKLPIRAADWSVEPASDDPADEIVADCVAWQFGLEDHFNQGRLDLSWDESLQQALLCLDFGSMFEEIEWADPEIWTDQDGDPHWIRPMSRLAPRFPATIDKVTWDRTGEIGAVVQDVPGTQPIPGERICEYILEREGKQWWGSSLLRPMYGPWRLKKALQIAAAIGWDRFAAGTPIVRYPVGGGPEALKRAEAIGRGYRNNERGYVALEGPKPSPANPNPSSWDVEILSGSGSLADPTPLIRIYDEQIATAGLQHVSRLGMTGQGSRAVGDVFADTSYLAVQAIAKTVAAVRMKRAVRRFVDVNFGPTVSMPRLIVSKIQARNIPTLAASIADLSAAGLTFTDADTQNDIRDQLDLRHLPDDLAAALEGLPPEVGVTNEPTQSPAGTPSETDPQPAGTAA